MANYIAGKITSNQLFSKYLEKSLIDSTQIEEILNCIKICRFKFNDDREFDAKIFYYIFLHSYKENDIDIRNKLIEMSDIFINTDCEKEILEISDGVDSWMIVIVKCSDCGKEKTININS